jgi:hypothetical protein
MKKPIAFSICALLGALAGYAAAPIAASIAFQTNDPELAWGSVFGGARTETICDCVGRAASENIKSLSQSISTDEILHTSNPNSKIIAQDLGLTYVRLSMIERKIGQEAQSEDSMKHGQAQLKAIGWKDVSERHLVHLVTQLNSEFKPAGNKTNSDASKASATK